MLTTFEQPPRDSNSIAATTSPTLTQGFPASTITLGEEAFSESGINKGAVRRQRQQGEEGEEGEQTSDGEDKAAAGWDSKNRRKLRPKINCPFFLPPQGTAWWRASCRRRAGQG